MDGPITCEQLRNIKKPFEDAQFKKFVDDVVNLIKLAIIQHAYQGSNSSIGKHMYKVDVSNFYKQSRYMQVYSLFDKSALFDSVMCGLLDVFPDMKIRADPLKTYLLLDWS